MKRYSLIGLLAACVAAAVGMLKMHQQNQPAAAAPAVAQQLAPAPAADAALPKPAESDEQLRSTLGSLTPASRFHDWLAGGDLLRRWVGATDEIARDVSPRAELPFLQPGHPFKTVRNADGLLISPRSYARFDIVGNVAGSIDARKFASGYRTLQPLLETAYHQLGYPGQSFDAATASALRRISEAPVFDRSPGLSLSKGLYRFTDPSLEASGPVEKAMIRMGPRNTRLVQQAARDISAALGMPLPHRPQAVQ